MRLHKIIILLLIQLFTAVNLSNAQRSFYTEPEEGEDYYQNTYERNLDSLHKTWVIENYLGGPLTSSSSQLGASHPDAKFLFDVTKSSIRTSYHPRVGEILDIYLDYGKKTQNAMAVYEFYRNDIANILSEYKMPEDIYYLPFAMSSMYLNARNETGAMGYWQLMYPVARKYGLSITSYQDDRTLIHASTKAAAQYLQQLNSIYNNWELSLAAYLCGPSNVNKAIRRADQQMEMDSIYAYLPAFARDASYALIASKILFERMEELSLTLPEFAPDLKCDTVELSQRLHFEQVQAVLGVEIKRMRFLNPQYKFDIVPAIGKVYTILLPQGQLEAFNAQEDSIYRYKDSLLFRISPKVVLPPPVKGRRYAKAEPEKLPENSAKVYYTIKSGDNLGFVADWYDVNVRDLERWNNIYDPRRLQIGQKIKIYVPKSKQSYYSRINTMSFDQKQKLDGSTVKAPVQKSTTPKKSNTSSDLGSNYTIHTIKSGESAYIIAQKYPGVSADDILRWNNIKDPKSLRVGQKLKIKKL